MLNRKKIALFVLATVAVTATKGFVNTSTGKTDGERDFPARALAMAKTIHDEVNRDVTVLNRINKNTIARDYGSAMARIFMAHRTTEGVPYLWGMISVSQYCWISIKPGSLCGLHKLPESQTLNGHIFDGILFISDWIHSSGEPYFLMIISGVAPQETIIARVSSRNGVTVLYDTSANTQECPLPPGLPVETTPSLDYIATVYRVKAVSSTSFELYEGNYTGIVRSAKVNLLIGPSSCRLQAKTETFYIPPTASRPGRIEKADGGSS